MIEGSSDTLASRRVLLGVTGSISAYKSAELARMFVTRGYEVQVVMTRSAQEFITPLTMQSVTGNPVITEFWSEAEGDGIGHIELADWAEALVIAPATADVLAKLVAGIADSPLHAIALATRAPILVAPAMNVNMWTHPTTQRNLEILRESGVSIVPPEEGALACGWNGTGRLADPWQIFHASLRVLSHQDFAGRRVLISTGPTREAIDPVRFLSNRSSGKMGIALAKEAYRRGAEVTLVHGPIEVRMPEGVECVPVVSAREMRDAIMNRIYPDSSAPDSGAAYDLVIMASAVADFRPREVAQMKIKKKQAPSQIALEMNPDILKELGERRNDSPRPVLVGFAVETGEMDDLLEEVSEKLSRKGADLIVGNLAEDAFDLDTNRVWLLDRTGKREEIATTFKSRVANKILNRVLKL